MKRDFYDWVKEVEDDPLPQMTRDRWESLKKGILWAKEEIESKEAFNTISPIIRFTDE